MKLLELLKKHSNNRKGYWVEGGSLVFVPEDRVREIPVVLREHLDEQARRERLRTRLVRSI